MLEIPEIVSVTCAVLGICGVIFKIAVLVPFENKIDDLSKAIDSLQETINRHDDRVRAIEIHVAELEQRIRSNQHRLDAMEATKLK